MWNFILIQIWTSFIVLVQDTTSTVTIFTVNLRDLPQTPVLTDTCTATRMPQQCTPRTWGTTTSLTCTQDCTMESHKRSSQNPCTHIGQFKWAFVLWSTNDLVFLHCDNLIYGYSMLIPELPDGLLEFCNLWFSINCNLTF